MKSKKLKHGSLAAALTAVFLVVVVLVNIVATILIERFDLSIDVTGNKIYEMSDQTTDYLKGYGEKTTIYVLADEDLFKTASTEYGQAYQMIEKFRKQNSSITTEYINLSESPDFQTKFPNESLATGDIIVAGDNGRYKHLTATDLFEQNYDTETYQAIGISSKVEQSVASALEYISGANPASAVMITNHQENSLDVLVSLLEKNNYDVSEASLLNGEIDSSADLVIIGAPVVDFTDEEIAALESYLNNDGKYGKADVYIASAAQPDLPKLEAFLLKWGIQLQSGLVLEYDQSLLYQFQNEPFVFPGQNAYTERIANPNLQVLAPNLKPMSQATPTEPNVTVTPVMSTSDTVALRPSDASSNWSATNNDLTSFEVTLAAEKTSDGATSRIVAFSSIELFQLLEAAGLNNGDFALSVINTAANKQSDLQIVSKSLTPSLLNINLLQAMLIMVVFVILIPAAVLIVGLVVWLRRRNR